MIHANVIKNGGYFGPFFIALSYGLACFAMLTTKSEMKNDV